MNCVHCGAELSDREEICTLCGKLAKAPDAPETPTGPPDAPPEKPVAPPAEISDDANEGAAFCTECKKFVYLDANGCCDKGHQVT